jgi:hypothetical protein
LAGEHGARGIRVRVASAKAAETVQLDLLGRLGRVVSSPSEPQVSYSVSSGTLGTPTYSLRIEENEIPIHKLIDNRTSVPSVPSVPEVEVCQQSEVGVPSVPKQETVRLPYLTSSGDLVIPFDSPERYHWWKPPHEKRLRVSEILAELWERKENDASSF